MPPGISIVGNEVKVCPRDGSEHSGAETPGRVSPGFSYGQSALLSKQSRVAAFHQVAVPGPARSPQDNDKLNDGPMRPRWVPSPEWGDEAQRSFKGMQMPLRPTTLPLFPTQIISRPPWWLLYPG